MRNLQKYLRFICMLVLLAACGPLTPVAITPPTQSTSSASDSPVSIPASWRTFEDPALKVALRYPESWQTQTTLPTGTRISGPDGFFELTNRLQPATRFEQIETWCILAANDPSINASYGPQPVILVGNRWNPAPYAEIGNGCVVVPSDPTAAQAVMYRRSSLAESAQQLVILRADANHFGAIISSLKWPGDSQASPGSGGAASASSLCQQTPTAAQSNTRQVGEFVLDEVALANAKCDPLNDFAVFQARVKELPLEQDNLSAAQAAEDLLTLSNRALAPFSYRLAAHPATPVIYDLFKGDELLLTDITYIGGVSVNAAGDDFILWVEHGQSARAISEVRLNSVRTLKGQDKGFNSAWLGANLIRFGLTPNRIEISSNDQIIQIFNAPPSGPTGIPLRKFWSWQEHWFVEVANVLMQDGEIQNLKLGYEEIFAWRVLDDQPFFMMRKGPTYGMVYAGQELPVQYEDILHGDLCCDLNSYRIMPIEHGVQFYALKDGDWWLVSIKKAP